MKDVGYYKVNLKKNKFSFGRFKSLGCFFFFDDFIFIIVIFDKNLLYEIVSYFCKFINIRY